MLDKLRRRMLAGKSLHGCFSLRGPFTVALLVALAGCAVGPDFAPPAAPVANSWLEWRNKSLQTGPQENRDWWRVFRDPILDRLIDIAYEQNLTLLSAGTRVLQARAQLGYCDWRVLSAEAAGGRRGLPIIF